MEILVIAILIGLAYLGTTTFILRKMREVHTEELGKAIAQNLVQLKPENRYILSFPFDISDVDFDELVKGITLSLDLENSNTHIVVVQGRVNMIEFN